MTQSIATIAVVVADYDAAVAFYRAKLGFTLLADIDMGGGKRWVLVAPEGGGARLLLAKADGPEQSAHVGNQTGGRVGAGGWRGRAGARRDQKRGRCLPRAQDRLPGVP